PARSKPGVGPDCFSENLGGLVPREEGKALGWFHRATNTSRFRQWKDYRLVPPEST
ncbi:hypothetical protein LINPERHAP1_LOCUS37998, partial [Linum perenne]